MTGTHYMMIGTMVVTIFFLRIGIPFLQKRFNRPIWEYKPTIPVDVLHRHHRLAVRMVYAQFFVVTGFVSSMAQWAIVGVSGASVYPVAFFGMLLLPAGLFGILGPPWFEEINRALTGRGFPVPENKDIAATVKSKTKSMFFWLILAWASPWITRGITTFVKGLPSH